MNSTGNNHICRLTGLLLLIIAVSVPLSAQDTPYDQLKQKFQRGEIFNADFSHQVIDSFTGDTTLSSGIIWVGENRYKVLSENKTIMVSGDISRVYDEDRNRLIISNYEPEEDDFAPSRFLNGTDSTYRVTEQREANDRIHIHFTSEDPFAVFTEVNVTLNSELLPLRIYAVDHADIRHTTRFRTGRFIKPGEQLFVLDYPDDAEIIDMRN